MYVYIRDLKSVARTAGGSSVVAMGSTTGQPRVVVFHLQPSSSAMPRVRYALAAARLMRTCYRELDTLEISSSAAAGWL